MSWFTSINRSVLVHLLPNETVSKTKLIKHKPLTVRYPPPCNHHSHPSMHPSIQPTHSLNHPIVKQLQKTAFTATDLVVFIGGQFASIAFPPDGGQRMTFDTAGEGRWRSLKDGDEFGTGKKFRGVGFVYNLCVTQASKPNKCKQSTTGMRCQN